MACRTSGFGAHYPGPARRTSGVARPAPAAAARASSAPAADRGARACYATAVAGAIDPVVDVALRGALGVLFARGAVHKLRDGRGFRGVLRAHRLVPEALIGVAAAMVPLAELVVVVLLVAGTPRAAGPVAAAALLALYAAVLAAVLARGGRHLGCGCGDGRPVRGWMVGRNLALAVAALAVAASAASRPLWWGDAVAGIVAALAVLGGAAGRLRLSRRRGASPDARRTRSASPTARGPRTPLPRAS